MEYKVRQPFSGRRLGGAAIALTAVTCVGGLAMAPAAFASPVAAAQAKPAAAAPSTAGQPGSQVKPDGSPAGCTGVLEQSGYTVTLGRWTVCIGAATGAVFSQENAYLACLPAMSATGVDPYTTAAACAAATFL
jgi:hypothetical protein